MSNDARIKQQSINIPRRHACNTLNIETVKHFAEAFSLAQNGKPAQARLESFETDFLEKSRVVTLREAPLMVVIRDVKRVRDAPLASCDVIVVNVQSLMARTQCLKCRTPVSRQVTPRSAHRSIVS